VISLLIALQNKNIVPTIKFRKLSLKDVGELVFVKNIHTSLSSAEKFRLSNFKFFQDNDSNHKPG